MENKGNNFGFKETPINLESAEALYIPETVEPFTWGKSTFEPVEEGCKIILYGTFPKDLNHPISKQIIIDKLKGILSFLESESELKNK